MTQSDQDIYSKNAKNQQITILTTQTIELSN